VQKRLAATAIASASIAVIGAGTGVVAASPSAAHHSTGVFSACLTASNTLINVTKSPAHRINCPSDTTRVTWNARGPRGKHGAAGATGATGHAGSPGTPGANGSSVLNGTGAPTADVGTSGDFYIDTQNWKIYGPKTASGWPATGQSLQGPSGGTGAAGTNGTNGTNGTTEVDVVRNDGPVGLPPDGQYYTVATYNLESGGFFLAHAKVVVTQDGNDAGNTPLNVTCELGNNVSPFLEETPDVASVAIPGDSTTTHPQSSTLALTNDYDTTNGNTGQTFPISLRCKNNVTDSDADADSTNQPSDPDGDADDVTASYAVIDVSNVNALGDANVGGFVVNPLVVNLR
jgi:hypothetical protein